MKLNSILEASVKKIVNSQYKIDLESVEIQATRKDFEGDVTVVVFPMLKHIKGNPVEIATIIGKALVSEVDVVEDFNVVKGFLNIVIKDSYYIGYLYAELKDENFGFTLPTSSSETIMVEYSSPNTNKPLHLGHIRNNLLGYSVSQILKAAGNNVYKTQIINDRGIHICKSMLAWQRYGDNETPATENIKGDKFVGKFYVRFNEEYSKEVDQLLKQGISEDEAKENAPILLDAQELLRKWESGDEKTVALWKKMNEWVYEGFEETYKELGVNFDCLYYESETYLLGKAFIEKGLESGVFFKKEDGSVWCDLTDEGLDEKLVLRKDGTAVYMTQDIGTAVQRIEDYPDVTGMVYTVGNEQDYHFKVLFLILKKLGFEWAKNLYHLSYGMVDLPSGKMKSREGTVVDADDLIEEMVKTAAEISEELGKLEGLSNQEKNNLFKIIGLGALKYHILKVDPKKRILFDPKESIDFQGNTGPFIQYTYARIQSILRKSTPKSTKPIGLSLDIREKNLIKRLLHFPDVVQFAAAEHSPALIANYIYEVVKEFNSFYQNIPILSSENEELIDLRLNISQAVGTTIKNSMSLLGIQVPSRM